MTTRPATHASSWYTSEPSELSRELDEWLARVPSNIEGKSLPMLGARIIIAPHAGYSYSGPAAAWAYKSVDVSKAKRVFLLGPSHTMYLPGCAVSSHSYYATPLGDLKVDLKTIAELKKTEMFDRWDTKYEKTEHSLEMHCPYILKILSQTFKSPEDYPLLIPILVGGTSTSAERDYGKILAPYLEDETSVFVVSSDFCHWGDRFQYTYYLPASPSSQKGYSLKRRDKSPTDPPIYKSIARLDKMAMDAVEGGKHQEFQDNLKETGNTVCGRHPIGVMMAALEVLKENGKMSREGQGRFKFIRYERSSNVEDYTDSSVSYASAVAIL